MIILVVHPAVQQFHADGNLMHSGEGRNLSESFDAGRNPLRIASIKGFAQARLSLVPVLF